LSQLNPIQNLTSYLLFSFNEFYLRNKLDDNGIVICFLAGLNAFSFLQNILDVSGACPRANERERASDNSTSNYCRGIYGLLPDMLSGFAQGQTCFLTFMGPCIVTIIIIIIIIIIIYIYIY